MVALDVPLIAINSSGNEPLSSSEVALLFPEFILMRIARFGILGALMFGVVGCQSKDTGVTRPDIPPLAFVRYINAVPDTFNLSVRFIDQLEFVPQSFANVPYGSEGQGGFQGIEAGEHRFRVFTYDSDLTSNNGATSTTDMLVDTTFTFVAGEHYTLLHAGFARAGQLPAQRLYIIPQTLPAENASVSVLAVNAATNLPAGVSTVDLVAGATTLGTGVAFGTTAAAYGTHTPGEAVADFLQSGTATVIASDTMPVGVPASGSASAIAGSTIGGSVFTAVLFGPSVPGSRARAASAPFIEWFADRQPPAAP